MLTTTFVAGMLQNSSAEPGPKRFVDLQEEYVSHDRGSRVVHYSLKDQDGLVSLAVVGMERSLRHMVYAVCEEFLTLVGLEKSSTPAVKWRSRREVVDWLRTFIWRPSCSSFGSDPNAFSRCSKHDNKMSSNLEATECKEGPFQVKGVIGTQNIAHSLMPTREILWVGSFWTCRKGFRHYNSFQRNGITISVHSFVYVMSEGRDHHMAYIEDMYEDKKCKKKVRVRWFHKTDELVGPVPPPAPHAREIFMTPFPQVLSVECVDGGATVLTPDHYEKCLLTLPDFAAQVHVCLRQFDNEGITPFDISNVKGYWRQKALLMIEATFPPDFSQSCDLASDSAEIYEDEETHLASVIKRGPRAARSSRKRIGRFDPPRAEGSLTPQHERSHLSCDTADAATGSEMEFPSASEGDLWHMDQFSFNSGDKIELLCEDSGVRGCWFRCIVLQKVSGQVKVRYEDLESGDGCGKLEEWVSSSKVAAADKLGLRASGRLTMRPSPSIVEPPCAHELGAAVDAWWNDGWWEGVLAGREPCGKVRVYFPDENDFASFQVSELRISRDWVYGQWMEIDGTNAIEIDGQSSVLHTERLLPDKVSENSVGRNKIPSHVFKAENTSTVQLSMPSQLPNVAELRTEVSETKEEKDPALETVKGCATLIHDMSSKKVSESGYFTRNELCHNAVPASSSRVFLGDDGNLQQRIELKQLDADRDKENKSSSEIVTCDGVRWKFSRKRRREIGASVSARSDKSAFIALRDPMSNLVMDHLQGREDTGTGLLTPNKKEVNKTDGKRSLSGHEQAIPLNGPSVSGSLFNSVSLASLVMSR